ncbi:5-bromo-4-chloroindolyl phosphate hydrolysis family protein [Phaeobacter sp. PT47_59]|uniref:5-bromo-4-chloroindolyl phosphate hydrolysis family protein n=1 Tax=Phaeobacter sp. PT47_59 TaxID=3029979 RepID=UPI0023805E25|nr:5-bromo-4-chloroindolyl phosphate hydrolysis family protein [Phaeobacter sp. PT47_59]MDE4173523.1 5-bromo-4-chloroindolyl phosphate hydrolysis family protein [Phaeobacter sp. PT47_59]
MAQRYGGKYSPDGADGQQANGSSGAQATQETNSFRGARVDPVGARANTMFVPGAILLIMSVDDGATGLALGGIAAALWTGGAFLLREGLRAEAAYAARKVARKPALPRKILASILTGAGAALAAWKAEPGLVIAATYGLAATGLHLAAFGIDPLQDKGVEGVDDFQQSRVARAVDEAESYLGAMRDAILRAQDRKLETRVERFQSVARDMFRTIEEDPRDLSGARKYLTVYLQGARDATITFADIYARSQDAHARDDYLALLDDLEQNFAARTQKMLLEDRSDLTIEIDVLRDRLQREGVRLDRN